MTCKEAEQLVQGYISGELEGKQLKKFIEHVQVCHNCFEELEINYMVSEGLQQLETGASINLAKEIKNRLIQSERKIRQYNMLRFYYYLLQIATYVILAAILFLAIQ